MPQWEFLDFIADEAAKLPRASACACAPRSTGLVERRRGRVVGVRGSSHDGGPFEVARRLHGRLRRPPFDRARRAGLPVEDVGAPIDVLWFRVGRDPAGSTTRLARIAPGHFVVTIDRGDYWQCAFVIAKGGADALRSRGIEAFRAAGASPPRRCSPRTSADVALVGRRQAAHRRRRSADASGRSRACSASATRRTRCRRSAASASTWRSRTRSPRPTCSRRSCAPARR